MRIKTCLIVEGNHPGCSSGSFFDTPAQHYMSQLRNPNCNIIPLLTGCLKNQRKSQKQLFFVLADFALGICHRYTAINDNPAKIMYEAFIRLFKTIDQFTIDADTNVLLNLKKWFKDILIDACIRDNTPGEISFAVASDAHAAYVDEKKVLADFSSEEIINSVRTLPYPLRIISNLSVDGFSLQDISGKLQIPVNSVEYILEIAKKELIKLLHPSGENKPLKFTFA